MPVHQVSATPWVWNNRHRIVVAWVVLAILDNGGVEGAKEVGEKNKEKVKEKEKK